METSSASFVTFTLLLLLLLQVLPAAAQETIWASVALTRTGERFPLLQETEDGLLELTSLGSRQMLQAGDSFRTRYLTDSSTSLQGLSTTALDPNQLFILAGDAHYTAASATAFLQGLYPPSQSATTTTLANGSTVSAPLHGYQYPWIHAASPTDQESIYLDGSSNCPAFRDSLLSHMSSPPFQKEAEEYNNLFTSVGRVLADPTNTSQELFSYQFAYDVYDYLSFQSIHDNTTHALLTNGTSLPPNTLLQLRNAADRHQWSTYGSRPGDETYNASITDIAGATLAYLVADRLSTNLQSGGGSAKISLLFAEFPAIMGFAALAGLDSGNQAMSKMPDWASSLVFEMFSPSNASSSSSSSAAASGPGSSYPVDTSSLRVRVLFRNGTDDTLFPLPMEQPLDAFLDTLNGFSIADASDWCTRCSSSSSPSSQYTAPFCDSLSSSNSSPSAWRNRKPTGNNPSPAVGGVIGAAVTLALVFIILLAGILLFRLRLHRKPRRSDVEGSGDVKAKGFRGVKLASDPDVSLVRSAGTAGGFVSGRKEGDAEGKGHERSGSWELQEAGLKRPGRAAREEEGEGLGREVKAAERL